MDEAGGCLLRELHWLKSMTKEAGRRDWSLAGEGMDTGVVDHLWLVVNGRGS